MRPQLHFDAIWVVSWLASVSPSSRMQFSSFNLHFRHICNSITIIVYIKIKSIRSIRPLNWYTTVPHTLGQSTLLNIKYFLLCFTICSIIICVTCNYNLFSFIFFSSSLPRFVCFRFEWPPCAGVLCSRAVSDADVFGDIQNCANISVAEERKKEIYRYVHAQSFAWSTWIQKLLYMLIRYCYFPLVYPSFPIMWSM